MPTTVLFARLSHSATRFRVHPTLEDVFVAEDVARCAKWFRPLLSVDLSRIRPDWKGVAFFVYFELGGRSESRFVVEDDRYRYLGDFSECDANIPLEPSVSWHAPFVDLVETEVPLLDDAWTPSPEALNASSLVYPDSKRAVEYWYTLGELAGERDPWRSASFFFAHTPHWTQSDETPLDPDGNPMQFVGQMRADLLTDQVPDFDYFLFFSPKHRLVTQVTQVT